MSIDNILGTVYNNLNNKRNIKQTEIKSIGDREMKRISEKEYKALTSYYIVKIISADDSTVLVKLVGKK